MPTGLDVQPSADFSVNGTTVDFNAIERLAAGEERVIRLGTTGRESGDQVIRFTLDCDILPRELTAETTTFFFKSKK
jgi:hypothetical protein